MDFFFALKWKVIALLVFLKKKNFLVPLIITTKCFELCLVRILLIKHTHLLVHVIHASFTHDQQEGDNEKVKNFFISSFIIF